MSKVDISTFPAVCARIKGAAGITTQKDLAKLLGLSSSGLANYLRDAEGRGKGPSHTSLPLQKIANWAISAGVSINWVLTGKEPEPKEFHPPGLEVSPEEQTIVDDVLTILRAGKSGGHDKVLRENIRIFKQAVESQQKLASPRPRKTATNAD